MRSDKSIFEYLASTPEQRERVEFAERSLLATCATHPQILDSCFPAMFVCGDNKRIFTAMRTEYDRTKPEFDLVSALVRAGLPPATAIDLFGGSYGGTQFEYIVKEHYLSRELVKVAYVIGEKNGLDAMLDIERRIGELRGEIGLNDTRGASTFSDWIQTHATLYQTGITQLDQYYGGIAAGEIVMIAGRPGAGKTTFGCTLAVNLVERGTPVTYHSYEMLPQNIWAFIVARKSCESRYPVSITDIRRRAFTAEQLDTLLKNHTHLSEIGLSVAPSAGVDVSQLAASIETSSDPVHIIDHIGLVPYGSERNEYARVTGVSNALQRAAKRSQKTIIELVQLHRGDGSRPGMADLRGSGHLEQDGELIAFLHEADRDANKAQSRTVIDLEVNVDKAREGQTGMFHVRVNRPYAFAFTEAPARPSDYQQAITYTNTNSHETDF